MKKLLVLLIVRCVLHEDLFVGPSIGLCVSPSFGPFVSLSLGPSVGPSDTQIFRISRYDAKWLKMIGKVLGRIVAPLAGLLNVIQSVSDNPNLSYA